MIAAADRLHGVAGDEAPWCHARAARLRAVAVHIDDRVSSSPIAALPPRPPSAAALGVVVDDPRYARVHALARRFISPRFALAETENPASLRPSFDLYELWTFLSLAAELERSPLVGEGFRWRRVGVRRLLDPLGTGGGAALVGRSTAGTLSLSFNLTFSSLRARRGARFSLTGERRPDLVLAWRPDGGAGAWVVLDAKYRVGRNLADGFESVHIYRDALRWDGFGGAARAGVLLAPAATPGTAVYFTDAFRDEHGLGAFELRPGVGGGEVVSWALSLIGMVKE